MKRIAATVAASAALVLACRAAEAKTLEDILKEKGVITEADYRQVTKSRPLDYIDGKGFTFTAPNGKFQLSMQGRLQVRYTFTDLDDNSQSSDSSTWEVKRMKLKLRGYAYSKDLTYRVQVDFTEGGSSTFLEDAYLKYRFLDELQILAGQTKVPFGRQWLNSSGVQQFVDRSTASNAFRPGYDMGAELSGELLEGVATYEFGVYGGAGQSRTRTSNNNAIAARVTVNPFGKMAYSESDLDDSPKPLLSVGANYYGNTLQMNTTGTSFQSNNITLAGSSGWLGKGDSNFTASEKVDVNTFGIDAAFKWHGFSAQGEYLAGQADGKTSGEILRAQGFYAQAGYCIIPKTLEVAFRYSYVDFDRDVSHDLQIDTQGAISYYFYKHNLKLQGDVTSSHIQVVAGPTNNDMIYRLQAQVVF